MDEGQKMGADNEGEHDEGGHDNSYPALASAVSVFSL